MTVITLIRLFLIISMLFTTLCTGVGMAFHVNMDSWMVATLLIIAAALANEGFHAIIGRAHAKYAGEHQDRMYPKDCDQSCEHLHLTHDPETGETCWRCDMLPDIIIASGWQRRPEWCRCPQEGEEST